MEKLILIAIIALASAISDWMRKRKKADASGNDEVAPPPSPRPASLTRPPVPPIAPPPSKALGWEEELRRLLEGDVAPPSRPRTPPPTFSTPPARPAAPKPPVRPVPAFPSVPKPVAVRQPKPAPLPVPTVTSITSQKLAPMQESRRAYEQGRQVDQSMAAHIAKVPGQHVRNTTVLRAKVSAEAVQAVSWFKNSRAARQAIIVSVILGPPKALE